VLGADVLALDDAQEQGILSEGPVRIAWVSHSSELGGAELSLLEAVHGLVEGGHRVEIALPDSGPLLSRLESLGAESYIVPMRFWMHQEANRPSNHQRLGRGWTHMKAVAKLSRRLDKSRPDLVVTNTLTIPVGALAAKAIGIPHVWYIHELGQEGHGTAFDYGPWLSYLFMRASSVRVIANSECVAAAFSRRLGRARLRVVSCAVETPNELLPAETASGEFRLVVVGRIAPGKRQEDAVRAASMLVRKGLNIRLALVGTEEPEYGAILRSLVGELGLDEKVTFERFTEDPFSWYRWASFVLVCSVNEAFGRVTVEAMKMGRPVVGARSAGTAELIRDGWNGFLYRPCDACDLAEKIEALATCRQLLHEVSANAHQWSREMFNREKLMNGLINVFREAIGQ